MVISSIPSSEPSSEELIVIIVGVCVLWAVVPVMDGSLPPMIVIWVLLGCARGDSLIIPRSNIVISGPELSALLRLGDASMIGASQGCLLVDCTGRSCLLASVSLLIKCGFIFALSVCGCGCILSILGLPLSVAVADVCCDLP